MSSGLDPITALRWSIVIAREGDNLYEKPEILLEKFAKLRAEYKCWAEHVGKKTGFRHYHCYVRFKTPRYRTQLVKKFGQNVRHLNGDDFDNAKYIGEQENATNFQEEGLKKKKDEQNAGVHVRKLIEDGKSVFEIIGEHPEYHGYINQNKWVLGQYEEYQSLKRARDDYEHPGELYEWQRDVLSRVEGKPHPRHILWYMDTEGDIGKSELAELLVSKHGAVEWDPTGDNKEAAQKLMSATKGKPPKMIVCDLEKDTANKVCWNAVEKAKNGKCQTGRYDCKAYRGQRPHIVMMSNENATGCPLTSNRLVLLEVREKKISSVTIDGKEYVSQTQFETDPSSSSSAGKEEEVFPEPSLEETTDSTGDIHEDIEDADARPVHDETEIL